MTTLSALEPHAASERLRRAAVLCVLSTVMLDVAAVGVITPILPDLVARLVGQGVPRAAPVFGVLMAVFALAQFCASPIQGALADRFGRRPVLLTSNLTLGVTYLVAAMTSSLWILFAARLAAGLVSASVPAAYAYLADVTPASGRARSFGLLGAAMALGAVAGPALGGALAGFGLSAPLFVAAGLSLFNGLAIAVVLRESLPSDQRTPLRPGALNPFAVVAEAMRPGSQIRGWLGVVFLCGLAAASVTSALVVQLRAQNWGFGQIGLVLTLYGAASVVAQAVLVGPALQRLGARRVVATSYGLQILAFLALALFQAGFGVVAAMALLGLASLGNAAQTALVSGLVGPTEQGRLQGLMRSVAFASAGLGPPAFTLLLMSGQGPGGGGEAAFGLAALLTGLAMALALRLMSQVIR